MRFLFRTDANPTIGTGHLMRCLALARALQTAGASCTFICRVAGLGGLARKIKDEGHRLLALPEPDVSGMEADSSLNSQWLPGGWQQDVGACRNALTGQTPTEWLVVDHYALDQRWELAMRFASQRLMVIDDLADRPHDCDVLLDQSLVERMAHRYDGFVPDRCRRLLGPRFALLRKEFERVDGDNRVSRTSSSPRVLIMFGGADAGNFTLRTVDALSRLNWSGAVDIVVGPLYGHLSELQKAVVGVAGAVLHESAQNIAQLMREADVAVGSPGVASWERCACGLPALTIAQADNQEPIAGALAEAGAHWYLGRAEQVTDEILDASLITLLGNQWGQRAMRRNALHICDGRGAQRVVRYLNPLALTIRRATEDDSDLLFSWRDDERIRNQSKDSRPLNQITHQAWLARAVNSETVVLFLACSGKNPVACIRFDRSEERARISIYTDPNLQGRGLGSTALNAAVERLRVEDPGVSLIEAEVLMGNIASHSLFSDAGFRPTFMQYELGLDKYE